LIWRRAGQPRRYSTEVTAERAKSLALYPFRACLLEAASTPLRRRVASSHRDGNQLDLSPLFLSYVFHFGSLTFAFQRTSADVRNRLNVAERGKHDASRSRSVQSESPTLQRLPRAEISAPQ
jgi:hypothetical protein